MGTDHSFLVSITSRRDMWRLLTDPNFVEMETDRPLPVDFIARRAEEIAAEMECEVLQYDASERSEQDAHDGLLGLASMNLSWNASSDEEDFRCKAATIAHTVGRKLGMNGPSLTSIPQYPAGPIDLESKLDMLNEAFEVTLVARDIVKRILERCPCCGELADQCITPAEK